MLQVLVIAAQDIAALPLGAPSAQRRAQLLLQHLDSWAQQHPQPGPEDVSLWKRLQTLAWCPVLTTPPEQGLPWPHSHPQQQQPGALIESGTDAASGGMTAEQPQEMSRAAPKIVAPAEMAWLVSGPLRLLAAPSPSKQLQELLGWTQQQVLRPFTASMQLAQLGEQYPAGTVRCLELKQRLVG
jgi:hypothetical protein